MSPPDEVFDRGDVIWGRRNNVRSLDCDNVTVTDDQEDWFGGRPKDQFSMSRGHVSIGPLHELPLSLNFVVHPPIGHGRECCTP